MEKWVNIDFDKCKAKQCNPKTGVCLALKSCKKKLLEQEELFDPPMLISMQMCIGCGDCSRTCPLSAIKLK